MDVGCRLGGRRTHARSSNDNFSVVDDHRSSARNSFYDPSATTVQLTTALSQRCRMRRSFITISRWISSVTTFTNCARHFRASICVVLPLDLFANEDPLLCMQSNDFLSLASKECPLGQIQMRLNSSLYRPSYKCEYPPSRSKVAIGSEQWQTRSGVVAGHRP